MELTAQQDQCLHSVRDWFEDPDSPQVYHLHGYAGTGKTTLASYFAEAAGGRTAFLAPTGKAALVLRQKGCPDPSTVHSAIYLPTAGSAERLRKLQSEISELEHEIRSENTGLPSEELTELIQNDRQMLRMKELLEQLQSEARRPHFILNSLSPIRDQRLIVLDEGSMVDEVMGNDLASFNVKILMLEDPMQLPPVGGKPFFAGEADFLLTDIRRQALDNPIIRMSMDIRQRKSLQLGEYGTSRVMLKEGLNKGIVMGMDQTLVGKNATRTAVNKRLRELHNSTSPYPVQGDRLVCLRNDHEAGLLNGGMWWAAEDAQDMEDDTLALTVQEELRQADPIVVNAHSCHFLGKGKDLPWWDRKNAQEFDYGYALTAHKAQGSQWDRVLVFDESGVFRAERHRWLYTAVTRAAEKVIIAR